MMDLILRIKEAVTIEETLSHFGVEIPPRGRDFVMVRCPWHEDKNPSMGVYLKTGRAWCYACNMGGDVIDVTSVFLRCDTGKAVEYWADRLGLSKEEHATPEEARELRLKAIENRERRRVRQFARQLSLLMEWELRPEDPSELPPFDIIYGRKDRLDDGLSFVEDFDTLRAYFLGLIRWRITALRLLRAWRSAKDGRTPVHRTQARHKPHRSPVALESAFDEAVLSEERWG